MAFDMAHARSNALRHSVAGSKTVGPDRAPATGQDRCCRPVKRIVAAHKLRERAEHRLEHPVCIRPHVDAVRRERRAPPRCARVTSQQYRAGLAATPEAVEPPDDNVPPAARSSSPGLRRGRDRGCRPPSLLNDGCNRRPEHAEVRFCRLLVHRERRIADDSLRASRFGPPS